jgi:hypothetical protein
MNTEVLTGTHGLPILIAVESANLGKRLVGDFPLISMDTNKGQSVVNMRNRRRSEAYFIHEYVSAHRTNNFFTSFSSVT